MKKLFEIQTLSDNNNLGTHTRLGDPVLILTAGVGALTTLFPNIFGGGRRALTNQDWNQLFPGRGYWTVGLKSYLQKSIHYNVDLSNIPEFTKYFVDENRAEICGGACSFTEAFSTFSNFIQQEKFSGGTSPVGQFPGGWGMGTTNWNQLLLLGGGVLLVVFLAKGKKRK